MKFTGVLLISVGMGDYFRLLTPGQYLVTASHTGFKPQTRRVKVTNPKMSEAVRLDFWLTPIDAADEALEIGAEYPQVLYLVSLQTAFFQFLWQCVRVV